MSDRLAVTIMIASLLVGLWCLVPAMRDRWVSTAQVAGAGVVELGLVVQAVIAAVRLGAGEHPPETATFIGYLVASVLVLPAAVVLSFLERTRWGSIIVAAAALIIVVMMLRLQQLWAPLHG